MMLENRQNYAKLIKINGRMLSWKDLLKIYCKKYEIETENKPDKYAYLSKRCCHGNTEFLPLTNLPFCFVFIPSLYCIYIITDRHFPWYMYSQNTYLSPGKYISSIEYEESWKSTLIS